ncbi:unnamed protein product [Ophioblennius macclurei]
MAQQQCWTCDLHIA